MLRRVSGFIKVFMSHFMYFLWAEITFQASLSNLRLMSKANFYANNIIEYYVFIAENLELK